MPVTLAQSALESAGAVRPATAPAERLVPASVTIERMRPRLAEFGITRLARQTGLDRVGIPCWAAFRPNALTLSNSQGKGIDDASACASALMEAVEFSIAEQPRVAVETTTFARLRAAGRRVADLQRQMPIGQPIAGDAVLAFVEARNLFDGDETVVPLDGVTVSVRPDSIPGLSRSSNGLASGNVADEAIFHGLCELVERDATTLSGLTRGRGPLTIVPLDLFDDPVLAALGDRIAAAGLSLWLTEETSDLGVPAFRAVIGERGDRYFDLAAGYGCHPVPARAAMRALTEAAQTRVTNIAGSRDDFLPHEYDRRVASGLISRLQGAVPVDRLRSTGFCGRPHLDALLDWLKDALLEHGVTDITLVPLGGAEYGIAVLKLIAPQLEDRSPNRNWRPGLRAVRALKAAA